MDNILVANAGSSSVKFQIFGVEHSGKLRRRIKGQIDGIGTRPHLRASGPDGQTIVDREYETSVVSDVPAALHTAGAWLRDEQRLEPSAVGHRVVHGGPDYSSPVLINAEVVARLERYVPLALANRLPEVAPEVAGGRVIVAHLGSGASMCALSGGRSIESTMGFTALDGIPMGTRPGQIDPGVILYLIEQKGMSGRAVQDFLYRECGLKGLSGISNDVRELQSSGDPQATFALDYFCYRVGLNVGMLAAALGGVDAFVFTAGIGENSALIRARIAEQLAWLGAAVDEKANAAHASRISMSNSRVALYIIPTDEEFMIARHTFGIVSAKSIQ